MEKISIKDIVSISGQPGLHVIVKADDKAIIVESLDERKKRQLVKGSMMASKLTDISIYTETESEPLVKILTTIAGKFGKDLPVTKKASDKELLDFLGQVLPDYDREKVYASNAKKLVSWIEILHGYDVDLTVDAAEETAAA